MMEHHYKVAVFGAGYVGLTTALCLAKFGYTVASVDVDDKKIKSLQKGKIPIFEKGLSELLKGYKRRINFTTDAKKAIQNNNIIFIAVGTPFSYKNGLNLRSVKNVAQKIASDINGYKIIVNKSTVSVGTTELIKKIISQKYKGKFAVLSNPEFLREGRAVSDFLKPNRIVIGSDDKKACQIVSSLYKKIKAPQVLVDPKSAEMIKYVSNAFLATKISFINEIANLCEYVGADINKVRRGIKYDPRIGDKFLNPGIGYGGSCFPKDTHALAIMAGNHGYYFHLLKAVIEVNNKQRQRIVEKAKSLLGSLKNKKIAVLGLSFKGNSDDVRESVAIFLIRDLKKKGTCIKAYDPQAIPNAKKVLSAIIYTKDALEAVKDSDLLIIATEWDEFKKLNFKRIKNLMRSPNLIDGRNILNPQKMKKLGFNYYGIGRK
jgi:UDPglucose 6-dehydrogenase